tara:strand:+ start:15884 stop:16390 length:507 start_codon:yes stop_codon:yes gene_type:complete
MRWLWIDRFTEFVSGSHARGFKNVTLAEEAIDDYSPSFPMLPPTLIIESLAQLGGVLILEHFNFEKRAVLAKVGKATYHFPARTGDRLDYHVQLDAVQDDGATLIGTCHCDGKLQANVDLMFAFLEEGQIVDGPLYKPGDLNAMLRLMNFFHVAVDADGNPLPHYKNL